MKVIKFIYEEKEVDFLPSGNDSVMVNATQMANIFDKRIDFFLKADHTKKFIEALLLTPKSNNKEALSPPYGGDNSEISTPNGGDKFKYSL
ncbi:hypothetical protein GCM10027284_09060 [Cyclobacterium sediminis]